MGAAASGSMIVHGITAESSNHVGNLMSLVTAGDDTQITFKHLPSTFNAVAVQADDGILLQVDITADTGVMTLDGDLDNAVDTHDKIAIYANRTLTSAGLMTLDSTSGGIVRSGTTAMSLMSAGGIYVMDDFSGTVTGMPLHVNADTAGAGTAQQTFLVLTGKSFTSTGGVLSVTAADIQVQGTLTSGTAQANLDTATDRSIGFGGISMDMDIVGAELQRISANSIIVGGTAKNKNIKFTGITSANSNGITTMLTIQATVDDSQVTFATTGSTFYAMGVQADNGVLVQADTTTSVGSLYFDADFENSSSADGHNMIEAAHQKTVASTTSLTLEATAGAIEAEGKLTFQAGSGIRITQDLLSQQAISFPLVIDSDFDSEGDGSLTVSEVKAIDSNNSDITVTAWDLDLLGFIRAGAGNVCIHGSKPSQTIGVGAPSWQ